MVWLALATIACWGLWGFFGRLALERGMHPATVLFAEALVATLFGAGLLVLRRDLVLPDRAPWNVHAIVAGVFLVGGLFAFYGALARGQASVVVPLTALYPAVTVLLAIPLLGERPSLGQWAGLALVLLGAWLLLRGPAQP